MYIISILFLQFLVFSFLLFSLFVHLLCMSTTPMTPNCVARCNLPDGPEFFVMPYIDVFLFGVDAQWFEAICLSWDAQRAHNAHHGGDGDTAWGAWKIRWWYWCSYDTSELNCHFPNTGSRHDRCHKKWAMIEDLSTSWGTSVLSMIPTGSFFWTMFSLFRVVMIDLGNCKPACWARNIELEKFRYSRGRFGFLCWHNLEGDTLPPHIVTNSTSVAQRGCFHISAFHNCLCRPSYFCLLFFSYVDCWNRSL